MIKRAKIIWNTFYKRKKLKNKNVRISGLAVFDDRCEFESNIHIDRFSILHNCQIGSYTYITTNCELANCKIGRFCSFAGGVKAGLGKHPIDRFSTSPVFYSTNNRMKVNWGQKNDVDETTTVEIGNDVWIGTNAIIVGEVKIGNGAIVAAGSVVTKDVPSYAIVGGVPAKIIGYKDQNNLDFQG